MQRHAFSVAEHMDVGKPHHHNRNLKRVQRARQAPFSVPRSGKGNGLPRKTFRPKSLPDQL